MLVDVKLFDVRDTVKAVEDRIEIVFGNNEAVWVNFTPEKVSTPYVIEYQDDTLQMTRSYFGGHYGGSYSTYRLEGIGTIFQTHTYWYTGSSGGHDNIDCEDRLLYFYNGQDTVYKAD